jgi:hypothetical protein
MYHLPQLSNATLPFRLITRRWRDWARFEAAPDRPASRPPIGANSEPAIVPPLATRSLPGKWPDSVSLLDRRMAALHLDAAKIAETNRPAFEAMKTQCTLCNDKLRCEHDLSTGTGNGGWRSYCANGDTLRALLVRDGGKLSSDKGD